MVPEVDRYDGSLVVLVDNQRQPVCQDIFLEGDVDFNILNGFRRAS